MDRQLIKALIDALEASDLTELEYSRDGATLRLVRGEHRPRAAAVRPMPPASAPAAPPPASVPIATDLVVAPLYGVVHLQRAPGAPPFVAAGQAIETGQVLCTIEAMKVFTEVRADRAGTVTEVMVTSGHEVEAGQPLMRVA